MPISLKSVSLSSHQNAETASDKVSFQEKAGNKKEPEFIQKSHDEIEHHDLQMARQTAVGYIDEDGSLHEFPSNLVVLSSARGRTATSEFAIISAPNQGITMEQKTTLSELSDYSQRIKENPAALTNVTEHKVNEISNNNYTKSRSRTKKLH